MRHHRLTDSHRYRTSPSNSKHTHQKHPSHSSSGTTTAAAMKKLHSPTNSISSPPPASDQPPIPISITICGDGGCGKSSITLRLVRSQWTSEYDPTIEDSYSTTRRIDGVVYHLSITDTAGQEEYRGMWASSSNLSADAFLLVYDITSRASLDALEYFNELIDMEAETRADNAARARKAGIFPTVPSYPDASSPQSGGKTVPPVKMVAGNKCDLSAQREVPAAVGLEWARRRGCGFMETSAKLEVNIEETFALLVRRVEEARRIAAAEAAATAAGVKGGLATHGVTKPLTPLPPPGDDEREDNNEKKRKPRKGGLLRWLRCW